jgi:hypothetical protein
MASISAHKEELKQDIRKIEGDFKGRISNVKGTITEILHPAEQIKKYPFKAVGVALGVGLVYGLLKSSKKKRRRRENQESYHPAPPNSGFTSLLFDELKHLAARKAMHYMSDLIDQQVSSLKKNVSDKQ